MLNTYDNTIIRRIIVVRERIMEFNRVKFAPIKGNSFANDVRKKVNEYFKNNNISKKGNLHLLFKFILFFGMYFGPFILMLCGVITGFWWAMGSLVIMGFGLAGIGLTIMHDANHGAMSRKKWKNEIFKYTMNLIGASSINWRIQHNLLHHGFTNIHGADTDIDAPGFLRFTPHTKHRKIHKYQKFYAWFFYGLMTMGWVLYNDIKQLFEFAKAGHLEKFNTNLKKELPLLLGSKLMYIGYTFVLPLLLTDFAFWQILIGFVIVHFIAGFTLAVIFQTAHVVSEIDFPMPDKKGDLDFTWAELQLKTTSNFATKNKVFTWLVGGLNYQIEHHLFPEISHVHYTKISQIVRETALEYGLPYYDHGSFWKAIGSHAKWLSKLGKA